MFFNDEMDLKNLGDERVKGCDSSDSFSAAFSQLLHDSLLNPRRQVAASCDVNGWLKLEVQVILEESG